MDRMCWIELDRYSIQIYESLIIICSRYLQKLKYRNNDENKFERNDTEVELLFYIN